MVKPPDPRSMTGFAATSGEADGLGWAWELRSVNGKGLDLRLRLPDRLAALEPQVKARIGAAITRGNVSATLKLSAEGGRPVAALAPEGLAQVLAMLTEIEARASDAGLPLAPMTAAEILSQPGVTQTARDEARDDSALQAAALAGLEAALDGFTAMRRGEGARLAQILTGQIDRIGALTAQAASLAEARRPEAARALQESLTRIVAQVEVEPQRVAQELALLAVKADVTEELDRLGSHIAAARGLLASPEPSGRKLDFLTQEFLREANTLCSKSGSAALTAVGLDLKHLIDQMREQVQNLE